MLREDGRHEATTRVRLYSAFELKALLRGCGFDNVKAYGSFEGVPYDPAAKRLEVVGYKT